MHSSSFSGSRVRPELPVHQAVALSVRDLTLPGDRGRGAEPVNGVEFDLQAGTLVLIGPASRGRTVILYLAGRASPADAGDGTDRPRPATHEGGGARLTIARRPTPTDVEVRAVLDTSGPTVQRAALRLGLQGSLDRRVEELDPAQQMLLGIAIALGATPDVIAFDDPGHDLDPTATATVVDALRDLVDVEGRTAILSSDLRAIPRHVRGLIDRVIDLGPHR